MKTGYDQFFKKAKETSQKTVKEILRDYPKTQNKKSLKKSTETKAKFPLLSFLGFLVIGVGVYFAIEQSEKIENFFKKIEISVGVALAEESGASSAKKEEPSNTKIEGKDEKKSISSDDSKKNVNAEAKPDEADYLFKLAERNKQLDQREEDLKKLESEIAKQKEELDSKLKKLEETRQKISTALEEKIKADDSKVETLVQMYSNMKAQQAAKVFETLDEELVIEILGRMKKKNAADILNLIKPEKAQIFAERYVGYRRAPASSKEK